MNHTVQEIIYNSSEKYGDLPAVKYLNHKEIVEKTYRELWEDSRKVSHILRDNGLSGRHIAIVGSSSYLWFSSFLGIINGGSAAVPLDAGLPAEELWDLINRSDAECLFCDVSRKDVAEGAAVHCPFVKQVYSMEEEAPLPDMISLKTMLAQTTVTAEHEDTPDPDALCTIMFTSGTTGKSKGVMLSHRNLADNVDSVYIDTEPGTVLLSVLPIHHAFCLIMDWLKGLSVGTTICINDSLLHMVKNMKRFHPRVMLMVPLMVETIYKKLKDVNPLLPKKIVAKEAFGGSLEFIFCGGARLDPLYIEEFMKYGIQIYQGYGMTECAPVISSNGQLADRPGSVGKPLSNCTVRLVEDEIQVRGSSVMSGYYKMPEETAETLQDGWLCTGDLGRIDEDGFLYITGRKKNLIILSNGENISPEELEGKLALEKLIEEIVITGNGNQLKAHIFPDLDYAGKKHMNETRIREELQKIVDKYNENQPTYKRIIGLDIRDVPFEKSSTRKIKRNLVTG